MIDYEVENDIEEEIQKAINLFNSDHAEKVGFLVLGRLAYEALRKWTMLEREPSEKTSVTEYKGLQVVVVEDLPKVIMMGCKPD